MDRTKKAALLTKLVEKLRERGSWCGETHIQKASLFVQDLTKVPLGFDFVLYKHGPFSFDLRDELTSMRADELLELEPQWPYGPRIAATERTEYIQKVYSKTLARYDDYITFVAEKLGNKGVAELERVATAYFLTEKADHVGSVGERATQLTKVKPHISREDALSAVKEADEIVEEWASR